MSEATPSHKEADRLLSIRAVLGDEPGEQTPQLGTLPVALAIEAGDCALVDDEERHRKRPGVERVDDSLPLRDWHGHSGRALRKEAADVCFGGFDRYDSDGQSDRGIYCEAFQ